MRAQDLVEWRLCGAGEQDAEHASAGVVQPALAGVGDEWQERDDALLLAAEHQRDQPWHGTGANEGLRRGVNSFGGL